MIWREHKLIFLHIPRTAGTAVELAVSGSEQDRRGREQDRGVWVKHLDAFRAEALWAEEFHDPGFMVCTILRNPLEVVVSQYVQNRAAPTREGFNAWLRRCSDERNPALYLTSAEADGYRRDLVADIPGLASAGSSMSRFLATRRQRRIMFLRFDRLKEDALALLAPLGIASGPLENVGHRLRDARIDRLPKLASGAVDYPAVYDGDAEAMLRKMLVEDFALWDSVAGR